MEMTHHAAQPSRRACSLELSSGPPQDKNTGLSENRASPTEQRARARALPVLLKPCRPRIGISRPAKCSKKQDISRQIAACSLRQP